MKNGSTEWMIEICKKLFRLYSSPSLHFIIIIICALTIQSSFIFLFFSSSFHFPGRPCVYIDIAVLLDITCYFYMNVFA